jgi:RNA polymerase sigma-70 factor (ECF subfamily)
MDDSALAARAAAGDHGAFTELVDRHGGRVLALATRIAGERNRGEDFCQEVFLHLLRVLPQFDPARPFVPWLVHVATNVCRNRARALRRRPAVSLDAVRDEGGDPTDLRAADPGTALVLADDLARVRSARDGLPESYRTVLALRYEAGLSLDQISRLLDGVPIGTVKNRLFRARAALAARLAHEELT